MMTRFICTVLQRKLHSHHLSTGTYCTVHESRKSLLYLSCLHLVTVYALLCSYASWGVRTATARCRITATVTGPASTRLVCAAATRDGELQPTSLSTVRRIVPVGHVHLGGPGRTSLRPLLLPTRMQNAPIEGSVIDLAVCALVSMALLALLVKETSVQMTAVAMGCV